MLIKIKNIENKKYLSRKLGLLSIVLTSSILVSHAQVHDNKGMGDFNYGSFKKSNYEKPNRYYDFGQSKKHSARNGFNNTSINTNDNNEILTQSVSFTDQYQNRAIAEWSLQQLNGSLKQVNDPWTQDTIKAFTANLNAQARQQSLYAVIVLDDSAINAFAIPGGVIGMNAGTVISANSLDEVASVMAHEVAHISQRHYEHGQDNKTKSLLIQAAGMVAATIAASASDGNATTAILAATSSLARDSAMSFSRANEKEADRVGMQIMAQAGYDVHAMTKFFATLSAHSQLNQSDYSFIPSYVRSHPLSSERMSEATARASQYPKASLKQSTQHKRLFDLLKWRLKVITKRSTEAELKIASKQSQGATLALAHWYAKNQRYNEAHQLLNQLLPKIGRHAVETQQLFAITKAELASDQGNYQQSINILNKQHSIYPERRDMRIYLADELINSDKTANAQQALSILQPMSKNNSNDRHVWQGLQLANEVVSRHAVDQKIKNITTINALRYRSYDDMWNARYEKALISLKQAKNKAKEINNTLLLGSIKQEIDKVETMAKYKP